MTICPNIRENINFIRRLRTVDLLANTIGIIKVRNDYNEYKGSFRNHLGKSFTSTSHHLPSSSQTKLKYFMEVTLDQLTPSQKFVWFLLQSFKSKMMQTNTEFQKQIKSIIDTQKRIMITDSDTVKFMMVDTPSYTSLFLLHKLTGTSQGKHQSEQKSSCVSFFNLSTSMAPWLLQLRSVHCYFYFQVGGNHQEVHQRTSEKFCTTKYFQCQSFPMVDTNRCEEKTCQSNETGVLYFHSRINLNRCKWQRAIIIKVE